MDNQIFTVEGYEHNYPEYLDSTKKYFDEVMKSNLPLFKTNTENLFDIFLNNLPEDTRQHYNCNACKHFVRRYGSLVTITEDGEMKSAIWHEDVPEFFKKSTLAMKEEVENSKVTDVFISDNRILGQPITGQWRHFAVELPFNRVNTSRLKTAGQLMAEQREEYQMLIRGLMEYPLDIVEQAVALLQSETLYRSDKVLGVAEFLRDLHIKRSNATNSRIRDNITWYAVATAPTGYCHVKSSMIGTLLDDIKVGLPFSSIKRRFDEKMDSSNYMRSQTAPTQNSILQAERVVERLGIANSLRRRYATLEEIPEFVWRYNPKKVAPVSGGVFAHLTPRERQETVDTIDMPTTVMTWEKFKRTVLPTADKIEAMVDNSNRLMAMVVASDENAPNILQWDNTFSWYYHGGIDGEIKRRVEQAGGRYENNEIRCSLIWEGYTDLDLHCITPKGRHIYFGQKRDLHGGYLDVDANGGSPDTYYPVENIRWANNAPEGRYKFFIHNYCERGNGITPFKAELVINGELFVVNGVSTGEGYKFTLFEFDYIKGQRPRINAQSHSSSNSWNIPTNSFIEVTGITTSPNLWGERPVEHTGSHIFFLLKDCKDLSEGKGRGFFNEMLKPELREIRRTLEAYTANTPIENAENASACGLGYSKDTDWNLTLRVTTGKTTRMIKIDRFD